MSLGLPIAPDLFTGEVQVPVLHTDEQLRRLAELESRQLMPRWFAAPLYALWEINGRCPLRCAYCYNASPKVVDELSTAELLDVAQQLADLKLFGVSISGGEPTLRKDLPQLLEKLTGAKLTVAMTTSGWTMTPALAASLRLLDAVCVSLDGARAETHDAVRRREGSFRRAVDAIRMLKDAGFPYVDVSFACTTANVHEFRDVLALCQELGVGSLRTHALATTGIASLNPEIADISDETYREVQDAIAEWNLSRTNPGDLRAVFLETSGHIRYGLATGRTLSIRITAEGYVGFTTHLPYVMGDVRRDRLAELWRRGVRVAWRHPEVRRLLGHVNRIQEVALKGEEGIRYKFLSPEEALEN
jgi:MoaA/NifB/PqqE/SkfB family radical SAM enzyme